VAAHLSDLKALVGIKIYLNPQGELKELLKGLESGYF